MHHQTSPDQQQSTNPDHFASLRANALRITALGGAALALGGPAAAEAATTTPLAEQAHVTQLATQAETSTNRLEIRQEGDAQTVIVHYGAKKHHKKHHKPKHKPHLPTAVIPSQVPPLTTELQPTNPGTLSFTPEAAAVASANTVYISGLGCSGFLIKDPQTQRNIGFETANHCGLDQAGGHRQVDGNGNTTVNFEKPLGVLTGDSIDALSSVGSVTTLALPGNGDQSKDLVIGALDGNNIQDVAEAYDQTKLSEDEINNLSGTLYNSGWPVNQPNNSGPERRQNFAMTILGPGLAHVTNGKTLKVLWAAIPKSANNAECSWGDSGSLGYIVDAYGKPRSIGTLSAFNDFGLLYNKDNPDAAAQAKRYFQNTYGKNLDGYDAVCGFAYETPSVDTGGVIANVTSNPTAEKPPLTEPQQKLVDSIVNSTNPTVIDGQVTFSGMKGSMTIDRPALYYDAAHEVAVFGWRDSYTANLSTLQLQGNEALAGVTVSRHDPNGTNPNITTAPGLIVPDMSSYSTQGGFTFGRLLPNQATSSPIDALVIQNGALNLQPISAK